MITQVPLDLTTTQQVLFRLLVPLFNNHPELNHYNWQFIPTFSGFYLVTKINEKYGLNICFQVRASLKDSLHVQLTGRNGEEFHASASFHLKIAPQLDTHQFYRYVLDFVRRWRRG